jgi:alkylated DNA repair dioxygenase AlkB
MPAGLFDETEDMFSALPAFPPGFSYFPAFISEEEEKQLLEAISGISLHTFIFQGFEAKRKTASFGYDYSFDHRRLAKGKEIPSVFFPLIEKVAAHIGFKPADFTELLVTEYPVGSVINWHRDAPPFDLIAGISLASDCTFKLRPHEKEKQVRSATISLPVKRRSLYIMQGSAREEWQHSISPVKSVRYSITLRTLKA